jgi:hypothetical protein
VIEEQAALGQSFDEFRGITVHAAIHKPIVRASGFSEISATGIT